MLEHPPRRGPPFRLLLQTTLDEILEAIPPLDIILRFIFQFRNRLPHDIRQQIDQAGARLHLRPVGGEGEAVLRDFQQGDAERPHVRRDGVGLALDALGGHVVGRADEGGGFALCAEFAGDAEVAELDLAVAAEEDVGRLDVAVDDLAGVEIRQPVEDAFGDFAEDFFPRAPAEFLHFAVDAVEGAAFAEFHGDGDGGGGFVHEGAVVLADVFGGAVFVEFQFAEDLFLDVRVGACGYYLCCVSTLFVVWS